MANFLTGIISLTLGVVVMSGVFISTVKTTNTTGWTSAETALTNRVTPFGGIGDCLPLRVSPVFILAAQATI